MDWAAFFIRRGPHKREDSLWSARSARMTQGMWIGGRLLCIYATFLCMPPNHAAASFAPMILSACGAARDKGVCALCLSKNHWSSVASSYRLGGMHKSGRRMQGRLACGDIYILWISGRVFPFPHFSLLLSAHCFDRDKGNAVSAVAKSAEAQSCSLSMSQYINAAMHAAGNKLDPQLETGKVSSHGQVRKIPWRYRWRNNEIIIKVQIFSAVFDIITLLEKTGEPGGIWYIERISVRWINTRLSLSMTRKRL